MKLTTRDSLAVLGLMVVITGGTILGVYRPQAKTLDDLNTRIISQKTALASAAARASVVPAMLRRVKAMKSRYKNFHKRLPRRQELGGFLKEISENLAQEDLSNQLIEPGNPTREELFHTLPIIMRFRGPYLALARFLERIEKMERLTRVQKMQIKTDPKSDEVDIELRMIIYFTES